ncbi:MAG: hypothetical protein RIS09_1186 [Actinomycetota bacterium]|jgi:phosphoribosylglycinamide formyltransferase-1
MSFKVVVLASGAGSLFKALLENADIYEVVALITDTPEAEALKIAEAYGARTYIVELEDFESRELWNHSLAEVLTSLEPDLVVSAGFMKIIGEPVISLFKNRIINTHPALLPLYPGSHAVRDALKAHASTTGATVHYIDAGMDTGEIIAQREVAVMPGDSVETLHERIKEVERVLLVDIIRQFAREKASNL